MWVSCQLQLSAVGGSVAGQMDFKRRECVCEWMISPVYRQMEPLLQTSTVPCFVDNIKYEISLFKWRKGLCSTTLLCLDTVGFKCADLMRTPHLQLSGDLLTPKVLDVTHQICWLLHKSFPLSWGQNMGVDWNLPPCSDPSPHIAFHLAVEQSYSIMCCNSVHSCQNSKDVVWPCCWTQSGWLSNSDFSTVQGQNVSGQRFPGTLDDAVRLEWLKE